MIPMNLILDGDNCWPELRSRAPEEIVHLKEDAQLQVAVLAGGMASGRPSVCLRLELPGGQTVLAETSARLFCMAAKAIMARHPDLFDGN